MPIPNQQSGEHDEAYVSRCIGELVGSGEYEQDQASAICYQQADVKLMNNKEWRREFVISSDRQVTNMFKGRK